MKTSKVFKNAGTKGVLVHTTLGGIEALNEMVETGVIGTNSNPGMSQPLLFKDKALAFCSYVSKEYREIYGDREGIVFETDSPVIYACPVDVFGLMRGGNWLPGHERFLFPTIEDMLKKYPTSADFRREFQEYFRALKPAEVYPNNSLDFAALYHRTDYCLDSQWNLGCNEITFSKPLKIKNPKIFSSREELEMLLAQCASK